ncbi:MAG TPA: hypothetical protein VGL71_02455 [Urbifossiella sp.]|jgi:hypothetical protein
MTLIDHPTGNYRFLPGIAPYSCGAVSAAGFEIVHAVFQRPRPYRAGIDRIAAHLSAVSRPKAALCGIELRSPAPFSFSGFAAFNGEYAAILKEWGLFVNGINPVARTNVAPVIQPPSEPVLYGFSYSQPCARVQPLTFVVAGAGELPEGILAAESIVARGDASPAGIKTKAGFVLDLMERRLHGLGADWPMVNAINVYTIHSLDVILPELVLCRAGLAGIHGARWHYTRPPITEIEFEMDLRGTRTEVYLD